MYMYFLLFLFQVWYLLGWLFYLQLDKQDLTNNGVNFRKSAWTYLSKAKKVQLTHIHTLLFWKLWGHLISSWRSFHSPPHTVHTHTHTHIFYLADFSTPPLVPSHFFHLSWLSQHAVSSFSTVKFLKLCWCPSAIEMENERRVWKKTRAGIACRLRYHNTYSYFFYQPLSFLLSLPPPHFHLFLRLSLLLDFSLKKPLVTACSLFCSSSITFSLYVSLILWWIRHHSPFISSSSPCSLSFPSRF